MSNEMAKLIEKLEEWYPDKMVVENIDEFERAKLAGKIELIQEIKDLVERNSDVND